MAQSLLISSPPSNTLRSPVRSPIPKRFKFSLKHDKSQFQEPADYVSPRKTSLADVTLNQDDALIDSCGVQDENASPNCKVPEIKLSSFVNPDVVDRKNDVSALGLPNCGNTCYLNSILQVLRYTPNFLNCIHSLLLSHNWLDQVSPNCTKAKEADLFLQLHMLYITMKKQEDFLYHNLEKDFSPLLLNQIESFLLSLREVSSLFVEGEQHDAHELLLTILSTFTTFHDYIRTNVAVHWGRNQDSVTRAASDVNGSFSETFSQHREKRKARNQQKRSHHLSVDASQAERTQIASSASLDVSSFGLGFEGKMRRIIKCLECEKKSDRDEPFVNLEVSIADELVNEGSINLCQCLEHKIILSGENKYFCEDCYHLVEAQLTSEITVLPSILLIHCSWLKQSSVITRLEKDSTSLIIPMSLKTSENSHIFDTSSDDIYHLYAIVLHLGNSTENGHYVSFIRDKPKVSELVKEEIHSGMEDCCMNEGILNTKSSPVNRWLLFDDQNVTPISVNETSDTFPYYKFLGIAASPCIIFYYKM